MDSFKRHSSITKNKHKDDGSLNSSTLGIRMKKCSYNNRYSDCFLEFCKNHYIMSSCDKLVPIPNLLKLFYEKNIYTKNNAAIKNNPALIWVAKYI